MNRIRRFWLFNKPAILAIIYVFIFFVLPWFMFMGQEDFDAPMRISQ